MKISKILLAVVMCALALASFHEAAAGDGVGLKKIVAVGDVNVGYIDFEGISPEQFAGLMRQRIKKALEETGRYAVVLPDLGTKGTPDQKKLEELSSSQTDEPINPADIAKHIAEMQKTVQKMQMAMKGAHDPVAAGALFSFAITQGRSSMDTGGVVGFASQFTDASLSAGDFSSDTVKISLRTMQQNPSSWEIIDEHSEQGSKTKFRRVAGSEYYTVHDSGDHDKAFDRMFKSAVAKTIRWIDSRMKDLPWQAEVVQKKGKLLYINAGSNVGIEKGMTLDAYLRQNISAGSLDLGEGYERSGSIQITQVNDKFSTAQLVDGKADIGSVLRTK